MAVPIPICQNSLYSAIAIEQRCRIFLFDPIPLTEDEIRNMGFDIPELNVDYKIGEQVEVMNGAFEGFVGTVQEINKEKNKVKVLVSMFGRETPVELEFSQVKEVQ